ncbi:MAG: dihydropyrimidinase [Thermodesulfobacteriota bacterium]
MFKKYDLLIKGGWIVTGSKIIKSNLAIKGEKIVEIKREIMPQEANRVIEASGKYVMPGVIDVHVHPVYEDDIEGLSLTAAYGGTTTLIHFAYAKPGAKLTETIEKYKEEGLKRSYLDFGIHGTLFDPASQIHEIPKAFDLGVSSFKMFMTYAKLGWMTDDYHLAEAMDLISQYGGLAMVHADNGLVTDYLEDRSLKKGEDQKRVFLKTRPDILEAEGIFRALSIAQIMRCPLYIVHLSTAMGVEVLRQAREKGQKVYVETCPQYLTLTDLFLQKWGAPAKIGPPLRTKNDRMALWRAIKEGIIDVIASDHAPKVKRRDDPFFEAPYGSPQAETMLTVTYDEGISRGRIKLTLLVKLLSENPAKIFGFYPKKGTIQKGSDADIVIFDPKIVHKIHHQSQHSKAPYTLYEGRRCHGKPILVMQRGRILIENGEFSGKPGEGQFLQTKIRNLIRGG